MKRRKKPVIVDWRDKGTPQTRKNKREGVIERGVREGWIHADMERAAKEIESIWSADMYRSMIKISGMERVDCSSRQTLPDRLQAAYTERYRPWCVLLAAEMKPPAFDIIIDVVIWDCSLGELNDKHKEGRGFSKRILIAGLKRYVDLAKWGYESVKEQSANRG